MHQMCAIGWNLSRFFNSIMEPFTQVPKISSLDIIYDGDMPIPYHRRVSLRIHHPRAREVGLQVALIHFRFDCRAVFCADYDADMDATLQLERSASHAHSHVHPRPGPGPAPAPALGYSDSHIHSRRKCHPTASPIAIYEGTLCHLSRLNATHKPMQAASLVLGLGTWDSGSSELRASWI